MPRLKPYCMSTEPLKFHKTCGMSLWKKRPTLWHTEYIYNNLIKKTPSHGGRKAEKSELRSTGSKGKCKIKRLDRVIETVEWDGFHCTAKRDISIKMDHAKLPKLSKSSHIQCKLFSWYNLSCAVDVLCRVSPFYVLVDSERRNISGCIWYMWVSVVHCLWKKESYMRNNQV